MPSYGSEFDRTLLHAFDAQKTLQICHLEGAERTQKGGDYIGRQAQMPLV